MKKHLILISTLICLCSVFSCSLRSDKDKTGDDLLVEEFADSLQGTFRYGINIDSLEITDYLIKSGDNMALIFSRLGFSPRYADSITRASSDVLDPTKIRAGMHYSTFCTMDSVPEVKYIAFAKSLTEYAVIDLTGSKVQAYGFTKQITSEKRYAEGTISSSLWNSLDQDGISPFLALKIADVYAWQIDFFDVKAGDSYQVVYDVAFIDDTTELNVINVHSVVFTHKNKDYVAIPFTQDSIFEFFDEEGNSLRKAFLKAPLDFSRITSRFSNSRFHPVLKTYRAHHGVDYAAPTGTPVKSIGAGTVIEKGYQANGGGNYLKVKHNSVYTTTYMHLSKFGAGIQKGSTVQQGQVIGYVGSTGLSTGPHLDFRVHKNGQPINPLNMEAPPSNPVKPELLDTFAIVKYQVLAEMDSFRLMHIRNNLQIASNEGVSSADEKEVGIN